MEIIGNLPQELSWNIMKYNSHPLADIIRPIVRSHPVANIMRPVIIDAKNYFGYAEQECYTSMRILNDLIYNEDMEEHMNTEYRRQGRVELDKV